MIKVYVTGFERPYGIIGDVVSENEQELVLDEKGVRKRIDKVRIVYIEEFGTPPPPPPRQSFLQGTDVPVAKALSKPEAVDFTPVKPQVKSNPMKEALQKVMDKRKANPTPTPAPVQHATRPVRPTQVDPVPPPPTYDPTDTVMIEVNFSGSKQAQFDISVPKGAMTGVYTPTLSREIFKHQEIKKVLADGTAILNGIPVIKENKVFYVTKEVKGQEQTTQDKMQMVGQLVSAGTQMMGGSKPTSTPQSTFSMSTRPSIPASPFDQVPTLSISEGDE